MQGDGRPGRAARGEGRRSGRGVRIRLLTDALDTQPPSRIRRVELRVGDVGTSADFYCRLAGLEVSERTSARAELISPDAGAPLLALIAAERPEPPPRQATGLFHTAFRFPDRGGLADALGRIGAAGIRLAGAADHGVSEALYLDDPDGLGIELYRDRPRTEWPDPGPGERVRMFTAPLDLENISTAAGEGQSRSVEVGHVHLKVADPDAAVGFWTERMRMDLMTRFGPDAVFLAYDGYHHHIGANAWFSRGAGAEPSNGPGLDAIVIVADREVADATTPDGIDIRVEVFG